MIYNTIFCVTYHNYSNKFNLTYMSTFICSKAPRYFQGQTGNINCELQGRMNIENDANECKRACKKLGIEIGMAKNIKDTGICHVAWNSKCRHMGEIGEKASRVCNKRCNI